MRTIHAEIANTKGKTGSGAFNVKVIMEEKSDELDGKDRSKTGGEHVVRTDEN